MHVGFKADSVGKGRSDAKKQAGVCVHELERTVPRVIRSRAYSTAHPNRRAGGLLGVQIWQAEQARAPAQSPRSVCSPESMCPVQDKSGLKSSFGAACSWSCRYSQCDRCVICAGPEMCWHTISALVERQTSRDLLSKHTPFCSLPWRFLPAPSPGRPPYGQFLQPLSFTKEPACADSPAVLVLSCTQLHSIKKVFVPGALCHQNHSHIPLGKQPADNLAFQEYWAIMLLLPNNCRALCKH